MGALSHDVIHGLDITEPLGLTSAPTERMALILKSAGDRNLAHFGVDLDGIQLVATDADVALGSGKVRRMPVKDMLLVVTGRRELADVPGVSA